MYAIRSYYEAAAVFCAGFQVLDIEAYQHAVEGFGHGAFYDVAGGLRFVDDLIRGVGV